MSSLFFPRQHTHYRHPGYGYNYNYGPLASTNWGTFNNDFQPLFNLFNDTIGHLERLGSETSSKNSNGGLSTFAPKFDVKETKEAYHLEGELPGIKQENLSIEFVDEATLVVKGRTEHVREEGQRPGLEAPKEQAKIEGEAVASGAVPAESAEKSAEQGPASETTEVAAKEEKPQHTYWLSERSVGSFQRSFSFPSEVNHEAVKASLKNGVLKVTIPKMEKKPETKGRKVEVETVEE